MQAHVIHAHSETDSFVAAMRDVIVSRLEAQGAQVDHSDLYRMGFNPVLSPADFGRRHDESHLVYALEQRHGFQNRTLAPDILREIECIERADVLVFTFPVFWFSVPAILKGWIDRVFISGPFYGGKRIYSRGGLKGKRAFVAFSLGGRSTMFGQDGIHGELELGMLRHFLQGTLGYVGLEVLEPFVAYHAPYLDDATRADLLARLSEAVDTLDQRGSLPMPDPGQFSDDLSTRLDRP
ncbi:NAD(P)H-dependent oxidoreductase [Xanthomonas hortorum]|uniref:NAD(P)H-dependent oxidoreductase n=1 Tax=Xanthomonas hortorum pv. hederae TaxID=453603 RepID=A0A9X3YYW0_9XANT|nr:NAD(P)H-dependent oxidoreductase [Xanthomonas hortorum]MCE4369621.1 NAD(P)H-dependent oxidoreductase [Xanthomonas hortorum pv. hederae]MDC8637119.1 NAD(P)H-dependent oxidoreductase [Xanthomonas hortorum pv. hederae]PPU86167.1 NAD(P)H dehydrogenase [Xanthomonas hortorum pv. hederae]PUF01231.1 flavodoxin family protein [Xanthomonas hortorum pv. hederae]